MSEDSEPRAQARIAAPKCDETLSGKYHAYIDANLDLMKQKCQHFTACIDELLKEESALVVLTGQAISLNKTCGLIYKDSSDEYYSTLTGRCSKEERNDIRKDIEEHLKDQFAGKGWSGVKNCMANNYGDTDKSSYVAKICKLTYQGEVCTERVHTNLENFFDKQIQQLRCTCENLVNFNENEDHSHVNIPAVIGAGVGGLLFAIILFLIGFICYKRRKSQKRKKPSPDVIYVPAPNSDNCPVYQELFDVNHYRDYRPTPGNPPTLPMRYKSHTTREEEPAYLEPVEARPSLRPKLLPGQSIANPAYDDPPEYTETAPVIVKEDESGYFQPLPSPHKNEKSYDLDTDKPDSENAHAGYESIAAARSSTSSLPLEEAPKPELPPLGPVPAKRIKKDDRKTESHYFVLEQNENSNTGSTV